MLFVDSMDSLRGDPASMHIRISEYLQKESLLTVEQRNQYRKKCLIYTFKINSEKRKERERHCVTCDACVSV
jgi:ferredoxin